MEFQFPSFRTGSSRSYSRVISSGIPFSFFADFDVFCNVRKALESEFVMWIQLDRVRQC